MRKSDLLLLPLLVLAMAVILNHQPQQTRYSAAEMSQLVEGMSYGAVLELIGQPSEQLETQFDGETRYLWRSKDEFTSLTFKEGFLTHRVTMGYSR